MQEIRPTSKEENSVKSQQSKQSKIAMFSVVLLAAMPLVASAQDDHERSQSKHQYSLASICGDYAAIATYGANIARALGTESFDGKGNLTGSAIANQPGPNSTRSLSSIGISGSYSMNADGTGKMVLGIALPDGTSANVTEDFVITKTKLIDGVEIATEIEDAQETPSAVIDDTSLVIHSYTLRSVPKSCTSHR
jgi:hypothetical protein